MKIAVPAFGDYVSPRFGFSNKVVVFTVEDGEVVKREEFGFFATSPFEFLGFIASLGVDAVICGGINGFYRHQLEARGISVIWNAMGEIEEVIKMYFKTAFRNRQGWRRRGRHGKRGWFFEEF